MNKEIIYHKNILYGLDHAKNSCILVEGVLDVWRLGYGAVSCFGAKTKPSRLHLLAERFKEVFIMIDDDKTGYKQAHNIAYDLSSLGIQTEICLIKGDPAELSNEKAKEYKSELIG